MDSIKKWLWNGVRAVAQAVVVGARFLGKFIGFAAAVTVDACIIVCTGFVLATVLTAVTSSSLPMIIAVGICMIFTALVLTTPRERFGIKRPAYTTVEGDWYQ